MVSLTAERTPAKKPAPSKGASREYLDTSHGELDSDLREDEVYDEIDEEDGENLQNLGWDGLTHSILIPSLQLSLNNARIKALNGLISKCKGELASLTLSSKSEDGDSKLTEQISKETLSAILQSLLSTIPRYSDIGRKSVLKALTALVTLSRAQSAQTVENPVSQSAARLIEKELKQNM
jgi:hypothetical protein